MIEDINELESKRNALHEQLINMGDFRRGIISVNYRKCGKKNCACARAGHPGHGPQYLWNTTIKGKSYAKNLKMGVELQKFITETENYRKFNQICEELVLVNEKICDLREAPEIEDKDESEALKKKLLRRLAKKCKKR